MLTIMTILSSCKKDKVVVKEIPLYKFNLETLLSLKVRPFEDVKSELKQYIIEESGSVIFYIQAFDGDKKFKIAFARTGTRISMIDIQYNNGDKNTIAEMKLNQELWTYFFDKAHNTYGEARTRLFYPYGGKIQIFNNNIEFINTVIKDGGIDDYYLAAWKIDISELKVDYNRGTFQIAII